jgi:hypothetical protein
MAEVPGQDLECLLLFERRLETRGTFNIEATARIQCAQCKGAHPGGTSQLAECHERAIPGHSRSQCLCQRGAETSDVAVTRHAPRSCVEFSADRD